MSTYALADRYDIYAPEFKPPIAGINGKYAIRGSNPVGDSLESDFCGLSIFNHEISEKVPFQ